MLYFLAIDSNVSPSTTVYFSKVYLPTPSTTVTLEFCIPLLKVPEALYKAPPVTVVPSTVKEFPVGTARFLYFS